MSFLRSFMVKWLNDLPKCKASQFQKPAVKFPQPYVISISLYLKRPKLYHFFINTTSISNRIWNIKMWRLVFHTGEYFCAVSRKLKNIFSEFFHLMGSEKSSLQRFFPHYYVILMRYQTINAFWANLLHLPLDYVLMKYISMGKPSHLERPAIKFP